MAAVDNINWSTLLNDTTVSAVYGNASDRIVAATEILQQTARQFAKVLNERASLLANSAQLEAALHDAAAIRTMLPGSGLGYLCTGDIYCQQGRYAAAIAIFDQGLEAVPESDPYHQHLQQHRMAAITNNNKCIDFISQLPLDIVITNILPRALPKVFTESSCALLHISRAWQERILKQYKGLYFDFGLGQYTFKHGHDQLVKFAPYVQKLQGTMELELSFNGYIACASLIQGLQMIADSLTHLIISDCTFVGLRDILKACPNLVSLAAEEVDFGLASYPSLTYPKMRHLSISCTPDTEFSNDEMIDFIGRFPSLLSLEIYPMRDSSLLAVFHKLCPDLQVLYYGGRSSDFDSIDVQPNTKGIRSVHLCGYGVVFITQEDSTFWELLHGQLGYLRRQEASLNPENDLARAKASFERLTNIEFMYDDLSTSKAFNTWFISNAPNLKSISITDACLLPNVMTNYNSLTKMKILCSRENDNVEGMRQLLENHIAMGIQSSLEEMTIHLDVKMSEVTWFPLISRLKCLKRLELVVEDIPKDCIATIIEISQGFPALEKLTIGLWHAVFAEGVLMPLYHIPNLKCLEVQAKLVHDCDLVVLAGLSSLKELYLYCKVPDFIREMLYRHISKVIVSPIY
ncbi:hypothetical protein LRAMOSA09441 [Lichtheimia ramosa]|uniref:Uncharacterized protein n=1 Tax=Lichtheimia ramosa TaxID=688394 RepID=A0A077WIM0_9FUNG|nr:hypothetical protein LRAMOSA09441 [Lichtheimia ramosa]